LQKFNFGIAILTIRLITIQNTKEAKQWKDLDLAKVICRNIYQKLNWFSTKKKFYQIIAEKESK
jgi:hypothetical protein